MSNQRHVRHPKPPAARADRLRDRVAHEVAAYSPPAAPTPPPHSSPRSRRPAEPLPEPPSSLSPDARTWISGLEWVGLVVNLVLPVVVWNTMLGVSNSTIRAVMGWTSFAVATNAAVHITAMTRLHREPGGIRRLAVTNLVLEVLNGGWWLFVALIVAVVDTMANAV